MKTRIRLQLPERRDRSYDIIIRRGVLGDVPAEIARRWGGVQSFLITDDRVAELYGSRLLRELHRSGVDATMLSFPRGESAKRSATVNALHSRLLESGVKRDSLIIALGGGVAGDIAGYAAATVLRGIPFVQIPTTLLAQVDSSVGGKVGIDHPLGKNLIGAFHQPSAVFIDPDVLRTLPEAEFRNGLAEVVKIAAALDRSFFARLERIAGSLSRANGEAMAGVIAAAVGLKAAVVMSDERETGIRKALNAGHTLGHALEMEKRFKIAHGAAVAMGLVAESTIARNLGLLPEADLRRLISLMRRLKLPVEFPGIRRQKIFWGALAADKKASVAGIRYALLRRIGQTAIDVTIPETIIREWIER